MSLAARATAGPPRLGVPVTLSAAVHVALVGLVLHAAGNARPRGEVYAVTLVAAPAGPRQMGVVGEALPKADPAAPIPKRAEAQPKDVAPARRAATPPRRTTSRATATPDAKAARFDSPAPKAGGGQTGGTGTDVANINTAGKEFPYPGYLRNIINEIASRFNPRQRSLAAEVQFVIRRDGSVFGISVVKGSGSFSFDAEAKGAIEAAASARAFGPLPDGFSDDVLTVIFSFDPKIIR